MFHLGVVKTLFEHGLLPRIISGASAGALMAALVCVKTDEELPVSCRQIMNRDWDMSLDLLLE